MSYTLAKEIVLGMMAVEKEDLDDALVQYKLHEISEYELARHVGRSEMIREVSQRLEGAKG